MKVLGISFTHNKSNKSTTDFFVKKALEEIECNGVETEFIKMADYNIMQCNGCGLCIDNAQCPLLDNKNDDGRKIYEKIYEADAFIFGFPVYALHPPASLINWLGRAPYLEEEDLEYDRYSYDQCQCVKGKCYRGKKVGLIAVSTGIGHEAALGSLYPALSAVRLTTVASAGFSILEYDTSHTVQKKPWAKNIEDADFAIQMCKAVGKRVISGSSAFNLKALVSTNKNELDDKDIKSKRKLEFDRFELEDGNDELVYKENINEVITDKDNIVILIGRGPESGKYCCEWEDFFCKIENGSNIKTIRIVSLDKSKLPSFISPDFIKAQVESFNCSEESTIYYDWKNSMINEFNIDVNDVSPYVVIIDSDYNIISEFQGELNMNNIEKINKILEIGKKEVV